jgi:hypothetical protein
VLARVLTLAMVTDEDGAARPWYVPFSEPARASMDDFRKAAQEREAEAEGLLLSFIGKLPGMAARLAVVRAHLDWTAEGAEEPQAIGVQHFGRAAHLAEAHVPPMARRSYADASVPKAERGARRLAAIIIEHGWRAFTSREVLRLDRAGLNTAAELPPALEMLDDGDCIRAIDARPRCKGTARP